MDRRQFVSRATLGAAAACVHFGTPSTASAATGRINIRFIGMMGFVERADRSFLVATPGQHGMHHMTHVPFLMARAGSLAAKAFGMTPLPGVVPEAFDTQLIGTNPADFVYRSLENTSLEIVSGTRDGVINNATEMAQMRDISPGTRLRGNVEKWASATVSIRGGELQNSSAHPDAHKVWSFGTYRQRLTDAVNYANEPGANTVVHLTSAAEAQNLSVAAGETAELWMISAATPDARSANPTRLEHTELLFDYMVDAKPTLAECADATGREVPDTLLPFVKPTSASMGIVASETTMPPYSDFCFLAAWLIGK
ncbi:MAG: hypothetical protein ABI665_20720 [Vicinamibacterales bacterium]